MPNDNFFGIVDVHFSKPPSTSRGLLAMHVGQYEQLCICILQDFFHHKGTDVRQVQCRLRRPVWCCILSHKPSCSEALHTSVPVREALRHRSQLGLFLRIGGKMLTIHFLYSEYSRVRLRPSLSSRFSKSVTGSPGEACSFAAHSFSSTARASSNSSLDACTQLYLDYQIEQPPGQKCVISIFSAICSEGGQ